MQEIQVWLFKIDEMINKELISSTLNISRYK